MKGTRRVPGGAPVRRFAVAVVVAYRRAPGDARTASAGRPGVSVVP